MLFALGVGDSVVAVTHECDYPPGVEQLPHLTRSVIGEGLSAADIDEAVRERTGARRGALRARRGCAGRSRRRPDRHPGRVRGVRGLLRRRPRGGRPAAHRAGGGLARPVDLRRGVRRHPAARRDSRGARGGRAACRGGRREGRGGGARHRGRSAAARGGARMAGPGLRGRPLGAADDRAGRRRGHARPARREIAHGRMGRGRGGPSGDRGLDAVRLLRRAGRRGDDGAARAAGRPGRPRCGGGRRGLLLAPRATARGRRGVACAHLPPDVFEAPPTRRSIELDLGRAAGAGRR